MKFEYKLFFGAGVFLSIIAILYWITSAEDTGTTMLVFGAFAYLMITSYLFVQHHKLHGAERPEDNENAMPGDGEGVVDFFPAASMWPVGIGLGMVLFTMGLMFGWWYAVIGGLMTVGGIIGFATEAEAKHPDG